MSLNDPTVEELVEKKQEIESKINFLEQKFRMVLLDSKSKQPFQISLKEYAEQAIAQGKLRGLRSSVPLNSREREALGQAFANVDTSFAKDYLKPYLVLEMRNRKIARKLDDLQLVQKIAKPGLEDTNSHVFRKLSDKWFVGREKGTISTIENLDGMHYIARLLKHPGREFLCTDLVHELHELKQVGQSLSTMTKGEQIESGLTVSDLSEPDEILRPPVIADINKEIRRKKSLIEQLEEQLESSQFSDPFGSIDVKEKLEAAKKDIKQLKEYLKKNTRPGGKSRVFQTPLENARTTVQKRIRTALQRIEKQDYALYQHLKNSIKTGKSCSYQPDRPIRWIT
ncbi:hypothetical protein MYX78_03635 [Acidobacteria bacterium AH-259-G07]|nr:hypothetical protein [Acidobacteria bacterium AH-259-G07]